MAEGETKEQFKERIGSIARNMRAKHAGPKVVVHDHSETHKTIVTQRTDKEGDHQDVHIVQPPVITGFGDVKNLTKE